MQTGRSKERIKQNGEVFTPPELVKTMLSKLDPSLISDATKTFLDPTAGDGNILTVILEERIKAGIEPTQALKTLYGVELMKDNTKECKRRLLEIAGDTAEHRKIVHNNIVCHDTLTWTYWGENAGCGCPRCNRTRKKTKMDSFLK